MANETYNRPEAHAHGQTHTCPCCLRPIKTSKKGVIARHGWEEEGRLRGFSGRGHQWGVCPGWKHPPVEVTDRAALMFAEELENEACNTEVRAEQRPPTIEQHVYMRIFVFQETDLDRQPEIETARALGVKFYTSPSEFQSSRLLTVTAVVPQGFEGLDSFGHPVGTSHHGPWVNSYEALQAERKKSLQKYANGLRVQAQAIRDRCEVERKKAT